MTFNELGIAGCLKSAGGVGGRGVHRMAGGRGSRGLGASGAIDRLIRGAWMKLGRTFGGRGEWGAENGAAIGRAEGVDEGRAGRRRSSPLCLSLLAPSPPSPSKNDGPPRPLRTALPLSKPFIG